MIDNNSFKVMPNMKGAEFVPIMVVGVVESSLEDETECKSECPAASIGTLGELYASDFDRIIAEGKLKGEEPSRAL